MKGLPDEAAAALPTPPTLDLNDILLDHPAASYIFRCSNTHDIVIVDRAATPQTGSLVIVKVRQGYSIEPFDGQDTWGVVTYQLHKTS